MTDPIPADCLYALKLVVDPVDRTRIAGRIEHSVSGRRFDFAGGAELLCVLAREQAGGYLNPPCTNVDAVALPFSFHSNQETR